MKVKTPIEQFESRLDEALWDWKKSVQSLTQKSLDDESDVFDRHATVVRWMSRVTMMHSVRAYFGTQDWQRVIYFDPTPLDDSDEYWFAEFTSFLGSFEITTIAELITKICDFYEQDEYNELDWFSPEAATFICSQYKLEPI